MLHNTFPPRSRSAPKSLTAMLNGKYKVINVHEKFLKVYLPVTPEKCSDMGKANFLENATWAKQCQADAKRFHSLLLPPSGSFNSKKILTANPYPQN